VAASNDTSYESQKVISVSTIPDQIKRMQVISCDFCDAKASFDVYLGGVISEVNVLKRYCEKCVKLVTQQTA
jgi:hypothetical protein